MRKSLLLAVLAAGLGSSLGLAPASLARPISAPRLPRAVAHPALSTPRAHASVIGGSAAQPDAFASVAEILDIRGNEVGECTGTVVAPTLVLTAGHCAVNMRTGKANAASGYRVVTAAAPGSGERQISLVSAVLVYEGFARRFARRVDDRDAALLVLAAPTSAPAVKLAGSGAHTASRSRGPRAGLEATIAGWGKTTWTQSRPTAELQTAQTVVQRPRWCRRNAPPFYKRSEICTIDPPRYATGACNGDSGGPLLAHSPSGAGWVEIGIVVHGYQRCSTRRPSVFTRVEAIAPWVQRWIDAYASLTPATGPSPAPPTMPAPTAPISPEALSSS